MIYKKEEYIEENEESDRFPVKRIEVLDPVEDEGEMTFVGQVSLGMQTPAGVQQIPVSFEIEADSVEEAFEEFEAHANPRIEEAREQIQQRLRQMQQESSNQIVTPGDMNMGQAQGQGGQGQGSDIIDFDNLRSDDS